MSTQTVHSTDEKYTSPLVGNGEIVPKLRPTGYQNGIVVFTIADDVNAPILSTGKRGGFLYHTGALSFPHHLLFNRYPLYSFGVALLISSIAVGSMLVIHPA